MVEIHAIIHNTKIKRKAFSKKQAWIIINQLKHDGAKDIQCDFKKLDSLR